MAGASSPRLCIIMNHLQVIKLNKFDIRNYIVEIISLVLSFLISAGLFKFLYQQKAVFSNWYLTCEENFSPLPFLIIKLIVWLGIYYFILKTTLYLWKWFWSSNIYRYRIGDLHKKWTFHGNIEETGEEGVLSIYNCYSGCLLTSYYWKKFELSFKINFKNEKDINRRAGILFYAEDLENYCMLQIIVDDTHKVSVKPHIRRHGLFEIFKETPIDISMEEERYYNIKIMVIGRKVTLFIDGYKKYVWYVPNRVVPNHIPIPYEGPMLGNERDERREGINVYKPFFVGNPGHIGFRASFNEKFKAKDIVVRKINN